VAPGASHQHEVTRQLDDDDDDDDVGDESIKLMFASYSHERANDTLWWTVPFLAHDGMTIEENCNISETGQDRTNVTIDDL